ncbi:MAG TPA: selenocysteine-specific translation elongation factor [Thermodesulfobacteriaceae bacterium]|nr:selenocysteine-specific translation elongation factor [Thermodesulfobacteriaceae bacterium]
MNNKTIILGTAGHIDHGKTTLVKAITGIDTDRLKEEKERGITIELGFAHLDLPTGQRIGVVDVPGHERFVKNMVAGAAGMDLVMLVIAADEGVMPQTREHLEICQLLGVQKGVIALTKCDMVDQDWLELVMEDVGEFVASTFLEGAPVVPVSSVTGEGLEDLLQILGRIISDVKARSPSGPYRLPVDRVFTVKGFGTVVTGTTISGQIGLGDEAVIYPAGKSTRIRGIQVHRGEASKARPGLRTALNLQGLDKDEVHRGDVLATPGSLHASYLLDLKFLYLSSAGRPLRHRTPVRFHAGTGEVIGRILLEKDEIDPGESVFAQIKLEEPVAVLPGDAYVIRSYSPVRTIGGGRILNPVPRKRKRTRPDLWEEMGVLSEGSPSDRIRYHLRQVWFRGLTPAELAMRTGLYGKKLIRELDLLMSSKKIVQFEGEGQRLIHGDVYDELKSMAIKILEEFHAAKPLVKGLSKEELKSRLFSSKAVRIPGYLPSYSQAVRTAGQKLFHKLLSELVRSGRLVQEKDIVRLASHKIALGEEEKDVREKIEKIFREAGCRPPSREDVLERIQVSDRAAAAEVFGLMVREGILVRLKDDLFFHAAVLEKVRDLVVRFLKKQGELRIQDFRELTGGISRKYMIALLENLDNQRVTIRIGDVRKLRAAK